jgi:thiamine-phosphate diphosphorylase
MRPRIILITDPAYGDDGIARCVEIVGRALPPGSLCVQLRDKQRAIVSLRVFASRMRLVTRSAGAALVINGDAALARDVGADGVHLGRGAGTVEQARAICGSRAWISVSSHSDGAVRRAVRHGADAVLVSPVFPSQAAVGSRCREGGEGAGCPALRESHCPREDCPLRARRGRRRQHPCLRGGGCRRGRRGAGAAGQPGAGPGGQGDA